MAVKFVVILERKVFAGPVTDDDVGEGEAAIFRVVQKRHAKFLSTLVPFYDQRGVLRMRGRAARSVHLSMDARFPVIVCGEHPAVVLLILHYHRANGHQNTSSVINELRQKVVMPLMRATARRVMGTSPVCCQKSAARPSAVEFVTPVSSGCIYAVLQFRWY